MQYFGQGSSGKASGGAGGGGKDAMGFNSTDSADYHQLYAGRQYYQQQNFTDDTKAAIDVYLDPNAVGWSVYSPSQQLNHKMRTGQTLNSAEQKIADDLQAGMHNLGYNVNLTRYDRVEFMERLGIKNYDSKSISTLKRNLVGTEFIDTAFGSTSYNDFAKAPNGGRPFTDKAIKLNIKAPASTQVLMPGIGAGGDLGEMLLAPNTRYRIIDLRFTGKQGRSGGQYYKAIELDVEILP